MLHLELIFSRRKVVLGEFSVVRAAVNQGKTFGVPRTMQGDSNHLKILDIVVMTMEDLKPF